MTFPTHYYSPNGYDDDDYYASSALEDEMDGMEYQTDRDHSMIKLPNDFIPSGEAGIHYCPPYWDEYKDSYPYGWYISVDCEYIGTENCDTVTLYLHSDGNWRYSTLFNGKFTGYYKTKEDAAAFLNSI